MNVPKLRFKEFNDEWKKTTLGESTTFKQGIQVDVEKQYSEPFENSVRFIRIVDYTQNTKDIRYISKPKNANYVSEHDVVLVRYGATAGFVGHGIVGTIANNMFKVTPNDNNIDKDFLYIILKQEKIYNKLNSSNGSSAMPALNFGSVSIVKINYPSLAEQNKLNNFLSLLDKKIELQAKKIEDLKLYKKGLSKKVFSNINVIEEDYLGSICNISTGKLDVNAMQENGKYRFYTCAKDFYYINTYAFDTEALLISGNGAYVGYIHYYKGKFNAYQRTYVLDGFSHNINYIKIYLDEFLSKRINSEKKEGNTPYIVLSTLSKMKIKITDNKTEALIINLFNNLNNKLLIENLKLIKLQELKKGLMQNMFV